MYVCLSLAVTQHFSEKEMMRDNRITANTGTESISSKSVHSCGKQIR